MALRAATFKVKDLSAVLDKAVASAHERHKVAADGHNTLFIDWGLVGRKLKNIAHEEALAFAKDVSDQVNAQGIKAEPLIINLGHGGWVAGWFPVERLSELQF